MHYIHVVYDLCNTYKIIMFCFACVWTRGTNLPLLLSSLAQVSYYFPHKVMWRTFFAAMTAAFTLQVMNPYFSGNLVVFYANYDHQWHLFEVIPFMVIGAFGVSIGAGEEEHHVGHVITPTRACLGHSSSSST